MVFPLHHTHGFHCYWADVWSKVAEPEGQGVRSCRDCTEMQGAEIRRRIMSDALNDRMDYLETYRFVFMGFGSYLSILSYEFGEKKLLGWWDRDLEINGV